MRRFLKSTKGNVAIMFALSSAIVLAGAGTAVDYMRKVDAVTELQAAVDGAALAASTADSKLREKTAEKYFYANFTHGDEIAVTKLNTVVSSTTVTVTADIDIDTSLMAAVGINSMKGEAVSAAVINDKSLEIVLVLDTQEVALKQGDVVILRGSNHAWSNRSDRDCVIAISSHDAA